jgi:imidazolonepropionase
MTESLLLRNIGSLITNASGIPGDLSVVPDAAVLVRDGVVVWTGAEAHLPASDGVEIDAGGRCVIPGFVDAHTHLVFGGDRASEFAARLAGASYEDILATGGGIHSTVAATRVASDEELLSQASARARRMLGMGTTTVEIKSGYGLTTVDEVRLLEVAGRVGAETGIGVVRTFLGAHVPDRDFTEPRYVDLLVDEMLPAAAPHADFCDVFVDRGAFSVDSARRILAAAAELELPGRLHAEQLTHSGAAALAAEIGAVSADHLDHVTAADAAALAAAGVTAVLLPGAGLSMQVDQAPARMLWDAGVVVALATDCNPGTSYVESMQLVVALGSLQLGLTVDEAVWAATRGGARSLQRDDLGLVVEGAAADLVVLDAPTHHHLAYRPGSNLAWKVIKAGRIVE